MNYVLELMLEEIFYSILSVQNNSLKLLLLYQFLAIETEH